MRKTLHLALLALLFASCITDLPRPGLLGLEGPYSNIGERTARPVETDGKLEVTPGNSTQYAYLPLKVSARANRLFIMLPGTLSNPSDYKLILKAAAAHGYHSMAIAYDNSNTISNICDGSSDPNCSDNILNEFLTGENTSTDIHVSLAESFENRIIKMLQYLHHKNGLDGWNAFFTENGALNWSVISMGGHSQGSTHALYISRKRPLLRAAFYSGPHTFEKNGKYPAWVTEKGLTPNEYLYAFSHTSDQLIQWSDARKSWNAVGIPIGTAAVDFQKNFDAAHRFFTQSSKLLNLFTGAHGATCTDKDTPIDRDRKPEFEKVWVYMSYPKP